MSIISLPRSRFVSSGFTLLELIVVIVIIMLLVGMIMGALSLLVKQQRRVSTATFLSQIETALQDYLNDYPRLGALADSSDFVNSPWTFLGRNMIAQNKQPYLGNVANKFLAVGPAAGPWSAGNNINGDQLLDCYPTTDFSNHFIWHISNLTNASGSVYVDRIYIRSTAGTPDNTNDDIVRVLYTSTGQWQSMTYAQSLTDIPIASW